jgi:hypothetical protein
MAAARKLAEAGVAFVLGHACSHAAITASEVYEEARILYMATNASNPRFTDEGGPTCSACGAATPGNSRRRCFVSASMPRPRRPKSLYDNPLMSR